jgi:hypothetical protein
VRNKKMRKIKLNLEEIKKIVENELRKGLEQKNIMILSDLKLENPNIFEFSFLELNVSSDSVNRSMAHINIKIDVPSDGDSIDELIIKYEMIGKVNGVKLNNFIKVPAKRILI